MNDIDPAELSALIDGELGVDRAREVQAAMRGDARLQRQFEALQDADVRLRRLAMAVTIDVQIRLPRTAVLGPARIFRGRWALALSAVPVAWLIGKLTTVPLLGLASGACALIVVIATVVTFVLGEKEWLHDAHELAEP